MGRTGRRTFHQTIGHAFFTKPRGSLHKTLKNRNGLFLTDTTNYFTAALSTVLIHRTITTDFQHRSVEHSEKAYFFPSSSMHPLARLPGLLFLHDLLVNPIPGDTSGANVKVQVEGKWKILKKGRGVERKLKMENFRARRFESPEQRTKHTAIEEKREKLSYSCPLIAFPFCDQFCNPLFLLLLLSQSSWKVSPKSVHARASLFPRGLLSSPSSLIRKWNTSIATLIGHDSAAVRSLFTIAICYLYRTIASKGS